MRFCEVLILTFQIVKETCDFTTSRCDEDLFGDTMTIQDRKACKITHFYKAFLNRTHVNTVDFLRYTCGKRHIDDWQNQKQTEESRIAGL